MTHKFPVSTLGKLSPIDELVTAKRNTISNWNLHTHTQTTFESKYTLKKSFTFQLTL